MNYEIEDLSANHDHIIGILLQRIVSAMEEWSALKCRTISDDPVVTVEDNYDKLYYDPDGISRSARYTHYVEGGKILRTQTTVMIPSAFQTITDDTLIVAHGLVYRRDVMDRTHVGAPHQADIWLIRNRRMGRKDLLAMLDHLMRSILPDYQYRCNETIHPYTVNGLEVEILVGGRWLEVLECGEAHPWLLCDNGLSTLWSGLAMGIGLDRLAMLVKGLDDIRLLRSTNPAVAAQMSDVSPYRPVSKYQALKRDLSMCVSDPDMELLGERIRQLPNSHLIEELQMVDQHGWEDVPDIGRERLGMSPHHTNILLRITMRSLDGEISKVMADAMYRRIYTEIHEGSAGYI